MDKGGVYKEFQQPYVISVGTVGSVIAQFSELSIECGEVLSQSTKTNDTFHCSAEKCILFQCSVPQLAPFQYHCQAVQQSKYITNYTLVNQFFYQEEKAVNVARDLRMPQFELEKVDKKETVLFDNVKMA